MEVQLSDIVSISALAVTTGALIYTTFRNRKKDDKEESKAEHDHIWKEIGEIKQSEATCRQSLEHRMDEIETNYNDKFAVLGEKVDQIA